jgi:hypothetical protein
MSKLKVKFKKVPDWQKALDGIHNEHEAQKENTRKSIRILVGPSFSLWEPCAQFDRILTSALEQRGCKIIPMYCDRMQKLECNCVGGDWGGGNKFDESCYRCSEDSRRMWKIYDDNLLRLSNYSNGTNYRKIIETKLEGLDLESLISFVQDGIDYGALAKDIVVNNYLVASIELVPDALALMKGHVANLMILKKSYAAVIEDLRPDRVISNDSYYGMWKILEILCKRRSIPFYSHWPVTKERVAIAFNDAAMNLDMKRSWIEFSRISLQKADQDNIQLWLEGKRALVIDTTKPTHKSNTDLSLAKIDRSKPTILLAANVIWDLAALNKQLIFSNMNSWIVETVNWFETHQDFQLIIKPHPAETAEGIPRTRETVEFVLSKSKTSLPPNVILLNSSTQVSVNQIRDIANLKAVVVHTTTVGFEYPAQGITAVTTAKSPYRGFGFTRDPNSKEEYFQSMKELLLMTDSTLNASQVDLARKFLKFYQFHYYTKIESPSNKSICEVKKMLIDKQSPLDYICEKIIAGLPIIDANEWLPCS